MSRSSVYQNRIEDMLSEDTEEFLWALANIMAERSVAIDEEAVLPRALRESVTARYRAVSAGAYEFAKFINPNRA